MNFSDYFNSDVLLILVHKHWIEVSFSGLLPDSVKISRITSLKGQVKYSCAAGRFEKRVKAEFINVSYTLFLPELSILEVKYF